MHRSAHAALRTAIPQIFKTLWGEEQYMSKDQVLESVVTVLDRADWGHSMLPSSCFDVLGRGDSHAALFKVQGNVDSVTKQHSEEMKRAARYLSASPLIIGERNSRGDLEKQVIYERYGIPTIKPETLEAYLAMQERVPVMNKKGGYYVPISAEKLEQRRQEEGYSLNALAKDVGVSSRTIRKYREDGMATVKTVKRLEQVLGDVAQEMDLFEVSMEVTRTTKKSARHDAITRKFVRIGFDASAFDAAPFDVAAKDEEDRFVARQNERMEDAVMEFLVALQHLADSTPVLIGDESADDRVSTISEQRLGKIKSKKELKEELR